MLPLDSPVWNQLTDAYGTASDIPGFLHQLEEFPPYVNYTTEPYFSLWSALCHQGDVYSASYAAAPHIIHILASAPAQAHWDFFLLPISIEIARARSHGPEIAPELRADYFAALARIPSLIAAVAEREWDERYCRIAAAALAVAKGQTLLGKAILELTPDSAAEFLEYKFNQ